MTQHEILLYAQRALIEDWVYWKQTVERNPDNEYARKKQNDAYQRLEELREYSAAYFPDDLND